MFRFDSDLSQVLDEHDALVQKCVNGETGFWEFCDVYNNFYDSCALDGHESDEEERVILKKHQNRIEPHRIISWEILEQVCSDEDAQFDVYQNAGHFGSSEALLGLK